MDIFTFINVKYLKSADTFYSNLKPKMIIFIRYFVEKLFSIEQSPITIDFNIVIWIKIFALTKVSHGYK